MELYPVLLSLEEGLERILQRTMPLGGEPVSLDEADGRVLAEDVVSTEDLPPFPRSPYDGYALRAEDTRGATGKRGVTLRIIEEIPAGYAPQKALTAGCAAKILTGAPIPVGADAVVKFEDTAFDAQTVTVYAPCRSGENIVPAGEDIRRGETVLRRGTLLRGAALGLLAGLGRNECMVYRRPRVELISTGDELVGADETPGTGQIRNSSVHALASYARRCGALTRCAGIVPDQVESIAAAIARAVGRADLVLTTGGVSVGDYDRLRAALEHLGAEILFWKLRIKPGSAFAAAVYQGTLLLGLSGNPSAAAVAFFLLGIPALRRMGGWERAELEKIRVRLSGAFPKKSPNCRFLPGRLEVRGGAAYLALSERQGNGMLHPLLECDLLGELPAGSAPIAKGSEIDAYRLFT